MVSSMADVFPEDTSRVRLLTLLQTHCRWGAVGLGLVRDSHRHVVGVVEGLLIAPSRRCITSLLVRSALAGDGARYLLPLGEVCAHLNATARCLEVDVDSEALRRCMEQPVDPAAYCEFSDDDLVECLFSGVRG